MYSMDCHEVCEMIVGLDCWIEIFTVIMQSC